MCGVSQDCSAVGVQPCAASASSCCFGLIVPLHHSQATCSTLPRFYFFGTGRDSERLSVEHDDHDSNLAKHLAIDVLSNVRWICSALRLAPPLRLRSSTRGESFRGWLKRAIDVSLDSPSRQPPSTPPLLGQVLRRSLLNSELLSLVTYLALQLSRLFEDVKVLQPKEPRGRCCIRLFDQGSHPMATLRKGLT